MNLLSKRFVQWLLLLCSFAVLAACGDANNGELGQEQDSYVLAFGGASPGGAAYQLSTTYAEIINSALDYVQVNVEVTGGGPDNVSLIQNGSLDSGHGNSGVGYNAYRGIDDFEGKEHGDLRAWFPLYNYPFQVTVLENSSIESIEDLKGKRIGVNVHGSGGEKTANQVFTALGLNKDEDYNPYYLDYDEALDALKTGRIDATVFSTGAPTPSLLELGTTHGFRILNFTEEELQIIDDKYPYYAGGTIPAGTYSQIDEDVRTVFAATLNYIHADLPEELVYDLTKAIWENKDRLESAHPTQKDLNAELIESALIPIMPLHPGAERYFKENGLID
ncbi:TAXI family TRAP transporter solute-binding subunit [Bacillus horti]|uniref:TRAP transporter TAXI family solute receptor n=1 Tax=Caldalkalibacillus horti TaxID=77523 RepID=A0ABT9W5A9_9BACI|nr:TAXI family TRAP transporter solute-binding subunit [Bacillus horti]MDQ0168416.1 TRAP transporter TAXI family solute receptor [Bacillus horti]